MRTILILGLALIGTSVSVPAQYRHGKARLHAPAVHASGGFHGAHSGLHIGYSSNRGLHVDYHHGRRHRVERSGRYPRGHHGHGHRSHGGYYKTVERRVWVDGPYRQVWVPAQYGYRYDDCGRRVRYVVHHGHYDTVRDPGYWEYRTERVWVPHGHGY